MRGYLPRLTHPTRAARAIAGAGIAFIVLAALPRAQSGPEAFIAAIEGPQVGREGDLATIPLAAALQKAGVPGLSVAVIKDFRIHWTRAYGVADVVTGAPATPDTLFQAASISKPVTAVAILKAVEQGQLSLDADVKTFLTSWRVPASEHTARQPVTLRGLLSHTSGTDDGFGFPGYEPGAPMPTIVQILNGGPPSNLGPVLIGRPPLTAFKYSGGGFTLAQLALTDSTRRPFAALLNEWVLGPLGMTSTTFEQPLPPAREAKAARAHDAKGGSSGARFHVYPELAAAGLWTTAADLARFGIEVQQSIQGRSNKVISRAMAIEMTTPVGVGPYGLGLEIHKLGEGWYLTHGGSNWGFQCVLVVHRLKGYGFAAMTNGAAGNVLLRELDDRIAAAYKWDRLDAPLRR
jgi:CubicO group peptidase (beta-lactamase class C family)